MPAIRFAIALPPTQVAWGDCLAAARAADELAFETLRSSPAASPAVSAGYGYGAKG